MKTLGKILIGSIFTSLLIALMLLITIRFELLNKSFIFTAFEQQKVYAQLPSLVADYLYNNADFSDQERFVYSEFAKKISPAMIKSITENNLTQFLNFLNGQSKNVALSFSLPGLGFQDASGFSWSIAQIPDKTFQENIKLLNGINNTFLAAILVVFAALIVLFLLYGVLSTPINLLEGKTLLISGGLFIVIVSLFCKIFLVALGKELIASQVLSQKVFGLLSASLFPAITTTWLIMGGILVLLWVILIFAQKYE